jgi:hypothetical protein
MNMTLFYFPLEESLMAKLEYIIGGGVTRRCGQWPYKDGGGKTHYDTYQVLYRINEICNST